MDTSKGFATNVLCPLVIFWAIMGFEMLSGVLENPLGNDETDMNLFERIHGLEVGAEQIFNSTEKYKAGLLSALKRAEDFVMGEMTERGNVVQNSRADPVRDFRSYFQWMPMPTVVLSDLMDSHGEVESLHQLWLNPGTVCGFSLRKMLRSHLLRRKDDRWYKSVRSEDERLEPHVDFNKDPTYFCHYLQFLDAIDVAPRSPEDKVGDGCAMEAPEGQIWRKRAIELLNKHPAQGLLKLDEDGTERSLMMQTPRRKYHFFADGWESLS